MTSYSKIDEGLAVSAVMVVVVVVVVEGKNRKVVHGGYRSGGSGVKTIINYRNGVLVVVERKQYKCLGGGGR